MPENVCVWEQEKEAAEEAETACERQSQGGHIQESGPSTVSKSEKT